MESLGFGYEIGGTQDQLDKMRKELEILKQQRAETVNRNAGMYGENKGYTLVYSQTESDIANKIARLEEEIRAFEQNNRKRHH